MKNKLLIVCLFVLGIISFVIFFITRNNLEYVVTFDSNGGSNVDIVKVKYHQKVNKPQDPTRENYEFMGWQNNGEAYDFSRRIEENLLLTASWKEKNTYLVVITLEDVKYESRVYENNVIDISKFMLPQKEGYHIVLYNSDQLFELLTPINSNLNLIAVYEKNG